MYTCFLSLHKKSSMLELAAKIKEEYWNLIINVSIKFIIFVYTRFKILYIFKVNNTQTRDRCVTSQNILKSFNQSHALLRKIN